MNRMTVASLIGVAVLLSAVPASHAGQRRGHEVDLFIGVGPTYAPPAYYVVPPPYYAPPPPVVYSPPVIVPSPVYVTVPPVAPAYWYFCPSYGAYYPTVPACPQPWVPVPAR